MIHAARGRGQIVLACASSGIASLNLPMGATAHSTFKIPVVNLSKDSTLGITAQSGRAELIRQTDLMLFDEISMIHKHAPECIDRTLRFLRGNDRPFGGVVMVCMGDFWQIPPVIPGGNRAKIIRASMLTSQLWAFFKQLELKINMRVEKARRELGEESAQKVRDWNNFLNRIGNGSERTWGGSDRVQVNNVCVCFYLRVFIDVCYNMVYTDTRKFIPTEKK